MPTPPSPVKINFQNTSSQWCRDTLSESRETVLLLLLFISIIVIIIIIIIIIIINTVTAICYGVTLTYRQYLDDFSVNIELS